MEQNKIYIILLILLFFFFSCTEEIAIRTDNSAPVIVIYGELTNEFTHQSVKISWSSSYFDSQPNAGISVATVTITSSNAEIYELFENDTIPGLYESEIKWAAEAGVSYSLKVDVDLKGDKKTYEASTTILSLVEVDSIAFALSNIMGYKHYSLNFYGTEPEGEDFYLCKYVVRDSLITTKISQYTVFDDILFDGQYLEGLTLNAFNSMDDWERVPERMRERSVLLASGDKVELQISRISKAYFNFVIQCQREMHGSNPFFGGPPSNITTNITNGGVGYFVGYCINKAEAIAP